jgi:hypothetical protein
MRVFLDRPDIVTMLHPMTGDIDFSGQYPTATIVANISKETKLSCGVEIVGLDFLAMWNYYSLCVSLRENAVLIGSKYYGLKGYVDLDKAFVEHLGKS